VQGSIILFSPAVVLVPYVVNYRIAIIASWRTILDSPA
jgi:hypothetical protein